MSPSFFQYVNERRLLFGDLEDYFSIFFTENDPGNQEYDNLFSWLKAIEHNFPIQDVKYLVTPEFLIDVWESSHLVHSYDENDRGFHFWALINWVIKTCKVLLNVTQLILHGCFFCKD